MLFQYSPSLLSPYFTLGKGKKLFQDQERLIIKHVFYSKASQREIIELTKIPQQTVSRVVKSLFDKDVFTQEHKSSDGSRGQPGYNLQCNPDFAYSVGIGILTDSIALAVMNFRGEIVASTKLFLDSMAIDNVMDNLVDLYDQLLEETQIDKSKILGLGVGISGYFTADNTHMNTHTILSMWAEIDISKLMSERFNLPCWLENDATAAAAGEGIVGIGNKTKNFVYFFISTGFGGGIVINNELFRGHQGNAGELGDIIPPKIYMHPNLENLRQILIKNGVEIQTIEDLLTNFDVNWPGVDEWVYKVRDVLSLVASAASGLLDTEAIILGGHAPQELSKLLAKEISIYDQHRHEIQRPKPNIFISDNYREPVAIGAASLPFRELCL